MVFVRHKSGPTYYGYECLGVAALPGPVAANCGRQNSADNHGGVTLDDVVVDDYDEVLWRLRALYGLKNFVGQRIVALGGPQGKWDAQRPDVARKRYKLDIVDVSYDDLAARLKAVGGRREAPAAMSPPGPIATWPCPSTQAGDRRRSSSSGAFAPLHGLPAVAARARRPGDHDQPVHGHDPLRVRTRPPACR